MKQKTLFEIPVYAMNEKEFNTRWDKKKTKLYNKFMNSGHSDESARLAISTICDSRCTWKYNQIVGCIKISVSRDDVWFDIYCSLDKIYYADSKRKHFIQHLGGDGMHFYIDNKSNAEIKQEIREYLKNIERDCLKAKFYVDYSTFNNIFDLIDIEQIVKML